MSMAGAFAELLNSPEYVEHRQKQEARRERRREAALRTYGSQEAVFDETAEERLLSAAVDRYKVWRAYDDDDGKKHRYIESLAGAGEVVTAAKLTPKVRTALTTAYAIPPTINGLIEEYRRWDALYDDRAAFVEYYEHPLWVRFRCELVEELIESRPAADWADLEARFTWWQIRIDAERPGWDIIDEQKFRDTLLGDIRRIWMPA